MDNKKAILKDEIRRLIEENNALRKELVELLRAADPAEGFLSEVALMPQLETKIRDTALGHREALRASIKMQIGAIQ